MPNIYLGLILSFLVGALLTYTIMIRRNAKLQAQLEQAQERRLEEQAYLQEIEGQFQAAFQNLAQEILDTKAQAMVSQNNQQMQALLEPLRQRLVEFQDKVENTHRESMIKIGTLEQVGLSMSAEAQRLTTALKGEVKTQGDWGEIILERILEASGLREGQEYVIQGVGLDLRSEAGTKIRPDVVIMLPENRQLIIDSKVSLVAYEKHVNSQDPSEQKQLEKELVRSLKNHVDGLKSRHYQGQKSINSPDFVLLFMPLEPAYALALGADPDLFQYAWNQKVIITTPTTLMATLWIIANMWQQAQQTANALEIARQGGALYDKFVGFVDSLAEIGRHLQHSQEAYDKAFKQLKTGKGNLVNRAENLRSLGVTTSKTLDSQLIEEAEESALA